MNKHSDLSIAIVDTFETAVLNAEAVSWEDLCVAAPFDQNSGYGIVVWGEKAEDGTKSFSVSLRQNLDEDSIASGREMFTAHAPLDSAYIGLLDAIDKVAAYYEQSLKEPSVAPVFPGFPYGHYSQAVMQPLLDALNAGDFALAADLTPAKYRLCGYQEFDADYLYEQYGHGWAGQFEHTIIPAGRYPVFAEKYSYHEVKKVYENHLKDFQGLYTYLCGNCISDSIDRKPEEYPFPNTVWDSPYCHAVAKSILDNNSNIHLIPPFEAVPIHFQYNGENVTTYQIVDRSLPEQMKQDPITLRNQGAYIRRTLELTEKGRRLYDEFKSRFTFMHGWTNGSVPEHYLTKMKNYSPETLQEILDKNFIQRREGDVLAYELNPAIRVHLFESRQMHFNYDNAAYAYKEEYERAKKEAARKPSLGDQIHAASTRTAESPGLSNNKSKDQSPER